MLVEFKIANYRSFWKPQTLSLVAAGAVKELQESNTFAVEFKGFPRLLRSAVLYGPNGSGKSNIIKGLAFMQRFVLSSSRESQKGESTGWHPFLLNRDGISQPGEFEVTFIQEKIRYQYGFKVTDTRVVHEWLLAYPEGRPQRWFERVYDPEKQEEEWYFGNKFSGLKKTWKEATRPNALFLSTAVQLNNEQLKPVYAWFQKLVIIRHGMQLDRNFTIEKCKDEKSCVNILNFLKKADIDVDAIEVREKKMSPEMIEGFSDMPEPVKTILQKTIFQTEMQSEVFFRHKVKDSGETISFPLSSESDGTQKLFAYAAPWMDVLDSGRILIIDELDTSFHPHIVRFLLQLTHTNSQNGQLVFSTHDTSILDREVLRRDQIWFMEKDREQATQLYPLSDFHPRKNEAIGKGYLQGRYGALPYIGEVLF